MMPADRDHFRQTLLADSLMDVRKRAKIDPDMRWLVSRYTEQPDLLSLRSGTSARWSRAVRRNER